MAVSKSNRSILLYSALLLLLLFTYALVRDVSEPISASKAHELIIQGEVKKALIVDDILYFYTQNVRYRLPASLLSPQALDVLVVDSRAGSNLLAWGVALLLLGVFSYGGLWWLRDKAALKKASAIYDPHEASAIVPMTSDVLFKDVAGIEDVKEELVELISFLQNPGRFSRFGVRMPRGLILIGPPGVGKTMIAKAVAGEAGVPFYYQSASTFVQIYVGMGAKRVHELFLEAKRNAPSIIFIDEIDAVGKMRGGLGRNDERDATLNQLLTEMDGFDSSSGVIVIAATNKIEVLDDALLRAGRFDRRIFVELPTLAERQAIVQTYLEKIPNTIDALEVAKLSTGFNGASLATLINEAALKALREEKIMVTMQEIEAVKSKVKEGKKRLKVLTSTQKMQQALYQCAKAAVALKEGIVFEKITLTGDDIVPVVSSLASRQELFGMVHFYLSGLAMMHLVYGEHFSNVQSDLASAKKLITTMVAQLGMGGSLIGNEADEPELINKAFLEVTHYLQSYKMRIQEASDLLLEQELLSFELLSEMLA